MERNLKNWARLTGYLLLLASMILSYRGFEWNFSKVDGLWSLVFICIGVLLTVAVSVIQLVFNTSYASLNLTLKVAGLLSYIYSIYTNYRGLQPFMSIDGNDYTVWVVAIFLDAVPEPLIAWSMGESLRGDLLGNIKKWIGMDDEPIKPQQNKRPKYYSNPSDRSGRPEISPEILKKLRQYHSNTERYE